METKPEVVNLINQVSQDTIESHIRYMQGFHRFAASPAALTVQNWLVEQFESYGYDDISIYLFSFNSIQLDAGHVVVFKEGTLFPDEYILITGHYDSAVPAAAGADDNASGTAGVLECARLLKDYDTKRSIMFVPFNAEEFSMGGKWMQGSLPFAQKCATENMNIIAHFNMDMISWFPPENPNTIMGSGYSYISKALFEYYAQTANIYVPQIPTIRFSVGDMSGSDHLPFNIYEYPSLYIGDVEYLNLNPCYHQPCDTLGHGVNRLDLSKAFVQAVLAASAELANTWLPPQNLSACSGTDKITVSWDKSGEHDSYKVFRNNIFLKETSENFYLDDDIKLDEKYEYHVIAINNGEESAPSNKDEITYVKPLELPYSNDFSDNRYGFEQSKWVLRKSGKSSLCNTEGNGSLPGNYLSIAELDWFPIPQRTENITIRFKWRGTIRSYVGTFANWNSAHLFFEVTNDRKTWHKLACMSGLNNSLTDYEFSLNQYINSDFFQARFRLEGCGAENTTYLKIAYITDVEVGYGLGIGDAKKEPPYISSFNFSPNPASNHINIVTNQHESYHIAIYDMTGRVIFAQEGFNDGTLSVAHLRTGNYLIVASTKQHRVARRLVIQ